MDFSAEIQVSIEKLGGVGRAAEAIARLGDMNYEQLQQQHARTRRQVHELKEVYKNLMRLLTAEERAALGEFDVELEKLINDMELCLNLESKALKVKKGNS